MLSADEAKKALEDGLPGITVKACVPYLGNFLARVEYLIPDEKDYDPFFLVNATTGRISEFSVLTDGNLLEIDKAFAMGQAIDT